VIHFFPASNLCCARNRMQTLANNEPSLLFRKVRLFAKNVRRTSPNKVRQCSPVRLKSSPIGCRSLFPAARLLTIV
jgi:hypothetical protein